MSDRSDYGFFVYMSMMNRASSGSDWISKGCGKGSRVEVGKGVMDWQLGSKTIRNASMYWEQYGNECMWNKRSHLPISVRRDYMSCVTARAVGPSTLQKKSTKMEPGERSATKSTHTDGSYCCDCCLEIGSFAWRVVFRWGCEALGVGTTHQGGEEGWSWTLHGTVPTADGGLLELCESDLRNAEPHSTRTPRFPIGCCRSLCWFVVLTETRASSGSTRVSHRSDNGRWYGIF